VKVVIPAAGLGKRLQPMTYFYPKPLLYVGRKRMIDYIMDSIEDIVISEIIMVVGYKGGMLEDYLRKNYKHNFTFVYQMEQSGLGDAVLKGIEGSAHPESEDLLVLLSDTIIDADMKKFTKRGRTKIAVKSVNNPKLFGIIETDGKKITGMTEKPENPKSNLAIVGLYYFSNIKSIQSSLEYVKKSGMRTKNEFQLTDAMIHLMESGENMESFRMKNWIDCGNFEMLIDSNMELLKRDKLKNYSENASVENSHLKGNVSLFENSSVKNSKLKSTIVFPNAIIEDCILHDSVIGEECVIKNFKGKIICSDKTIINK